jgi:hypothetical protein
VHVTDLQSAGLDQLHGLTHRPHVHVRCDERLDERAATGVPAAAGHLLDQHASLGLDVAAQHLDVGRVVGLADVLAHLHRRDGVVRTVGDGAVVLQPDLHPVAQTALGDPGVDERLLLGRDRDAGDLRTEVLGGVQAQRAPATADVEEPIAVLEPELAAHQVELRGLCLLEGHVGALVVAGRVRHVPVEDQRVELVGEVVVVTDRLPVTGQAVQAPADPGLGAGRCGRQPQPTQVPGRAEQGREGRRGRPDSGQPTLADHVPDVRQRRVEVALDVDLAGHVGLRRAELARVPEQSTQDVGRVEAYGGCASGAGDGAVPGGEPHGQVAADERAQRRLEPRGNARRRTRQWRSELGGRHEPSRAKVICWTSMYWEAKPARLYSR